MDIEHLIPNAENWTITVTIRELLNVMPVLARAHRSRGDESIVWLTRTDKRRVWSITERNTMVWFFADCDSTDPMFALPLPYNFLDKIMKMVVPGDFSIELRCDASDGSLVATCGERYVSVDHPEDVEFTEDDLPYQPSENGDITHYAVASMTMPDAQFFAHSLFDVTCDAKGEMPPFTHLAMGDGRMSWTIDWTRFNGGRHTGSVAASVTGEHSCQFLGYALGDVLTGLDDDDNGGLVKFFVDSDEADYLYVVGDDWGTRTSLNLEHCVRWTPKLHSALESVGLEIDGDTFGNYPENTEIDHGDRKFLVSLHASDGVIGDFVRFTYFACEDIEATPELLREINEINLCMTHATVIWYEGDVRVTTAFPATVLNGEKDGFRTFSQYFAGFHEAMKSTQGLDAFLPLFAGAAASTGDSDPGTDTNDES